MMFPMIPQYFFTTPIECSDYASTNRVSDISKNTVKVKKKSKIIVTSAIEVDVESENIAVDVLLDATEDEDEIRIYSDNNTLRSNSGNWSWLKQVHLAEDCHSCNVILYQKSTSPYLRMKAVRKILPGEKLVLWFSRELLLVLQIPFLLPNNILSEKQYICHNCRFQCEMPNPIKIHLSLECGKLSKSTLWNRLRELIFTDKGPNLETCQTIEMQPSLYSESKPEKTDISNSAFKPYKKICTEEIPDSKSTSNKVKTHSVVPNLINNDITSDLNEANILYKQAVEMETIVSNLGRFKQGHLCIYCGKVYSRKYGLKIHIRTHTGFKPLKCKFCLRPFGDPSNLNKHVRLHSEGDTPYKCEQCGKILVRKRDLDRHMKSRH